MNTLFKLNLIMALAALPLSAAQKEADGKKTAEHQTLKDGPSQITLAMLQCIDKGELAKAEEYLKQGADANYDSPEHGGSLCRAHQAVSGIVAIAEIKPEQRVIQYKAMKLLLDYKANPNQLVSKYEGRFANSPLIMSTALWETDPQRFQLLLDHNADVAVFKGYEKEHPGHLPGRNMLVREYVQAKEAKQIPLYDLCLWTSAACGSMVGVKMHLKDGGKINVVYKGRTPLMAAAGVADEQHYAVVAHLLSLGADRTGFEALVKTGQYEDGSRMFDYHRENLEKILAAAPAQKAKADDDKKKATT